jgi:D-beta-D-heptose 7-phosphate kinase/D-beta-D-heptose 1-phosphate adenosyltransferase
MDTQQQKLFKILLIGDRCTDKYHFGSCTRLSPEAPVPIFKLIHTKVKPGMVLNVKENMISFGADVQIITNSGNRITKERFIDESSGQQLLRLDTGENELLEPLNVKNVNIHGYDCIAISDYDKGFLDHDNCLKLSSLCKMCDIPLFVDSKKKDLSCFEGAIIKINEKEHKGVTKYPKKYDLITTLGEAGARWRELVIPAEKTEVFDVCGAGDTFFASFIIEYLNTKNILTSIMFANRCAAVTVKKIGATSLTEKEIEEIRNGIRV